MYATISYLSYCRIVKTDLFLSIFIRKLYNLYNRVIDDFFECNQPYKDTIASLYNQLTLVILSCHYMIFN